MDMRVNFAFVLIGFGALSGCAVPNVTPITSAPVEPQYTAAGQRLNADTSTQSEVRTFRETGGDKAEITGVPCVLQTPYYVTRVTTPAMVNLPSYAEKTTALDFSCTHEGKTVRKTLERINHTAEVRSGKWYVPGLLGAAVVTAATRAENSVFRYPPTWMTFK